MDQAAMGKRIRWLRHFHTMTLKEMADKLHITEAYLSHIERGIRSCSLDMLVDISHVLKVPPSVILQDSLLVTPAHKPDNLSDDDFFCVLTLISIAAACLEIKNNE